MEKCIAVIGGDRRQIFLAQLLREDGHHVVTYGLEKGSAPCSVSLEQALAAEIIVLPLPVCRNGQIPFPLSEAEWNVRDLFQHLSADQLLFGGLISSVPNAVIEEFPVMLADYYDREEVQIALAIQTAEGAIMRAIAEMDTTLHGSNCLVVGYGRIGKVLARHLCALGAKVSVAARKDSDLAWVEANGYVPIHISKLGDSARSFDCIFNTVPFPVFDSEILRKIRADCLLMELASLPGGFDGAVKEYNLRVIEERGLPGKVSPRSSALVIRNAMYRIMEEKGGRL